MLHVPPLYPLPNPIGKSSRTRLLINIRCTLGDQSERDFSAEDWQTRLRTNLMTELWLRFCVTDAAPHKALYVVLICADAALRHVKLYG